MNQHLAAAFVAALCLCSIATGQASYDVSVLAQTGDEPPERPGETFSSFGDPAIDGDGVVVFKGSFEGPLSGNEGIYRHALDVGVLERVVDDSFDFSPPGQSGASSWSSFGPPIINDLGDVHCWGTFSFGDNSQGLYLFTPSTSGVVFDDAPTQPVPGHPTAVGFTTFPFSAGITPTFASDGTTATVATFFDAGFGQHEGLYFGDAASGIARIVDDTLSPPGQSPSASFSAFDTRLAINGQGNVAFHGEYIGGIGSDGVYHFDRALNAVTRVADGRTQVPGQSGVTFSTTSSAAINDTDQVAFAGAYLGGQGNAGIYLGGSATLTAIVDNSGNFAVPGHPGGAFNTFGPPVVTSSGDVIFFATFGPTVSESALFSSSNGVLGVVFSFSDPVPGQASATFSAMGSVSVADSGHIAFTARYLNGVGNEGVYVHDGVVLRRVIDESDTTLGLALDNLHMLLFTGASGGQDGRVRTLSNDGRVVFRASLTGGGEAILAATPALVGPLLADVPALDLQPGGPAYDFSIAKFEVTNAEFAAFLNDAEFNNEAQNPGFGSELGDNLVFRPAPFDFGDVGIAVGDPSSDKVFDITRSLLIYNSSLPVGTRYSVVATREDHAATGMSWIGAAKYCNWLTITQSLGLDERCYAEGGSEFDWFPVTIGSEIGGTQQTTYAVRDLTQAERAALVQNLRGYRLAMDEGSTLVGSVNAVPRPYNEWYKAAAYDPAAPDVPRTAFPGFFEEHVVPADHWIHGYGRDPLFNADANFRASGDPFDDPDPAVIATTPVGYYDGSVQGGVFATTADANHFGLFDVSGNVWEFLTDQVTITDSLTPDRSIVGGSYRSNTRQVACANRGDIGPDTTRPVVGFRVMRVPVAPDVDAPWTDLAQGLAGTNGLTPLLTGSGPLLPGSATTLTLSDARPNTTSALVIGLSAAQVPFKGGTLVPAPDVLIFGLPVDGAGTLVLVSPWPDGLLSGTSLFLQHWVTDPEGPGGFAASNGLEAVTP